MWFEFFVLGGMWFWLLTIIEVIALLVFVEDENAGAALASIVIFLLAIHFFGNASLLTYAKNNPWDVLRFALIYAVLGFIWSMVKFYFQVDKVKRNIAVIKEKFTSDIPKVRTHYKKYGSDADDASLWKTYIGDNMSWEDKEKLNFSNNSSNILFWLTYWPISMSWTLLNDPIKRFFHWSYDKFLIGIYRNIHKGVLGDINKL